MLYPCYQVLVNIISVKNGNMNNIYTNVHNLYNNYWGWGRGVYKLCHDPTRRNISARVTSQLNSLLMSMSSIKIVPDVFVTLSFILGLLKWKYLKRNYLKKHKLYYGVIRSVLCNVCHSCRIVHCLTRTKWHWNQQGAVIWTQWMNSRRIDRTWTINHLLSIWHYSERFTQKVMKC